MNNSFNEEEFINHCGKGNIDMVKRKLEKDNVNIHCKDKEMGSTGAHAAAKFDQLEMLRFLASSGFIFASTPEELSDNEGNTPLHIASQRMNFEIMLFLIMNGHPTTVRNKRGLKPGDNSMEARIFLGSVVPEEKAFDALKPHHKQKLTEIFKDIDFDDVKAIDLHKAVRFNKYIEENIAENTAQKDAKDFIKCTAICNKATVNLDEWLFSFAKLYVCDEHIYEAFIADYDKAVANRGKLKAINI